MELLDEEHEEFVDDKTDDLKRDTKTGDTADTPVATTSKHVCSKVVPEQPEEKMSAKVTAKKSVEQIDRVGLNTFQTCFTQRLDKISA